jgi:hypothetical protein
LNMDTLSTPLRWSSRLGAASQASAAIGRAAAAQTARIIRSRYCGISTFETAASPTSFSGGETSIGILLAGRVNPL